MIMALNAADMAQARMAQQPLPPPQQAQGGPSPLAMVAAGTNAAVGTEKFDEQVATTQLAAGYGDKEFATKMMQFLGSGLASEQEMNRTKQAREAAMMRQIELLQPKEPSRFDAIMAGLGAPMGPGAFSRGNLGNTFATMGQAMRNNYTGQQDMELRKAQLLENETSGFLDKQLSHAEKALGVQGRLEAIQAKQKAAAQGKWVPSPKEPGVFINNATGERKVMSDADAIAIRELVPKLIDKYPSPQDALQAATTLHFTNMPKGAAAPNSLPAGVPDRTVTPSPATQTDTEAPPAAPTSGNQWSPSDISQGKKVSMDDSEAYAVVQNEITSAMKAGRTEEAAALQREAALRWPGGKKAIATPTEGRVWPKPTDKAAEAGSKTAAEEKAKMEADRVRNLTPGTPEYQKREAEVIKEATSYKVLDRVTDKLESLVKEVQGTKGLDSAVGSIEGRLHPLISASPDLKSTAVSKINNLKEYLQTRGLAEIRASGVSPGSVTEKEWPKFEAMLANIDTTLDEKSFKAELTKLLDLVESVKKESKEKVKMQREQYGSLWDKHWGTDSSPEKTVVKEVRLKDGRIGVEYSDGTRGFK